MLSHFPKKLFERESRPPTRHQVDLYQAASDALGVTLSDALNSRKAKPICARWGVWLALRDAGWGYKRIGRDSTSARVWDHSTIMNAVWTMRAKSGPILPSEANVERAGWVKAAREATVKALAKMADDVRLAPYSI